VHAQWYVELCYHGVIFGTACRVHQLKSTTATAWQLGQAAAVQPALTWSSSSGLYCTMKLLELPCARIGAAAANSSTAAASTRTMSAEEPCATGAAD
jgi:hypothetical protein